MKTDMTFKPNRSYSYLATFSNTPTGLRSFEAVRETFHELGCSVRRYGRGPRKKIYARIAATDPTSWEAKHPWTKWNNNHYRPKLKHCTHFDVYIYKQKS